MDPTVNNDALLRRRLVVTVNMPILDINAAHAYAKRLAQNRNLNVPAPAIRTFDLLAVAVRIATEDGGVEAIGLRLDGCGDGVAQFDDAVDGGAEDAGSEGAEEAAVVVGHDAQDQGGGVGRDGDFRRVIGGGVCFALEGEEGFFLRLRR